MLKYCKLLSFLFLLVVVTAGTLSAQTIHKDYWDGKLYVKILTNKHLEEKLLFPAYDSDDDLVRFDHLPEIQKLITEYKINKIECFGKLNVPDLKSIYKIDFEEIGKTYALIRAFEAIDYIEYAEMRPIHRKCYIPTDQEYNKQWYHKVIESEEAWDLSIGSKEVKVAICDDAVRISHEDLKGNAWVNPGEVPNNGKDDDGNGYVDDINGWDVSDNDNNPNPPNSASNWNFTHGTHCAGIAAGTADNGIGIAGMSFGCSLMAVKCNPNSANGPYIEDGWAGVQYAIAANADVISLSWGGPGFSSSEQSVINQAYNKGIVVCAAAGNDNTNDQFYPAAYEHIICVGASNSNDKKANFSNFGSYIDVMAPGTQIYSTLAGSNFSYGNQDGTSMACPLVAGLCGLMKAYNPDLNPDKLEECLKLSCESIDPQNPGYIGQLGAGRINAQFALKCSPAHVYNLDATISVIMDPSPFICETTVKPRFRLFNAGLTPLNYVEIEYKLDNNPPQTIEWSGDLGSQKYVEITLDEIQVTEGQQHKIILTTKNPNLTNDDNPSNDENNVIFTTLPDPVSLPFTEDFESNSFTTKSWSIENPDENQTWEIVNANGNGPGKKSARVNLYNYPSAGQRDGLVTPPIDFAGYQNVKLDFKHAYRRFSQAYRDSLIIYVSQDCGQKFQRVFAGGGGNGFATGYIIGNQNFVPQGSDEWCGANELQECFQVDLSDYDGEKVIIKFEIYNSYGNNIYLDDINIYGQPGPPKANFSYEPVLGVCTGGTVNYTNLTAGSSGNVTYEWYFPGGEPTSSNEENPTVVYKTPGSYNAALIASNENGSDTKTFASAINVADPPVAKFTPEGTKVNLAFQDFLHFYNESEGATKYHWDFGDGNTSEEKSPKHTYTQTGSFVVTLTAKNGGCETTTEMTIEVINNVGLDDELATLPFDVYPNPVSDNLHIDLDDSSLNQTINVQIVDVNGKIAFSESYIHYGSSKTISLKSISSGVYFIHLSDGNRTSSNKLIVID